MPAGLYPERTHKRIDYDRMNREHPKLKSMLTRAENSGDPLKVAAACTKAVTVWNEVGAWPDDWSRWRRAIEDAWYAFQRSDAHDDDLYDNGGKIAAQIRRAALPFDV